mgnify:CR=1 FL=1
MTVMDLTKDQMEELKQSILCDRLEREEKRSPSMGELADAMELVSDDEVIARYGKTEFTEDDFFCSVGNE